MRAETEIIDPAQNSTLTQALVVPGYKAQIERLITFKVQAFDWNCPQHIKPRFTCEEVTGLDIEAVKAKLKEGKPCGP